ncbi:hypothetical protein [Paracoccus aestuariivivens]|uniref:Uncharacterized protein n=1 Tax=Paracoccus aestuariivivens TaxID=1820333 RepID=A0A6L6JB66_9RHOB|nr:hypothetical protein [Paracoccus aestuariivivens]MTH78756.1 hypothetical protein [Paracoccus aestuariivivens]
MPLFFSGEILSFFDSDIHEVIPDDAQEISAERHAELLLGQSDGMQIVVSSDGLPMLREKDPLTAEQLLTAERARMVCSRFQARASLLQAGLLQAAEVAVAEADALVQLAWADAGEFRRHSPTIAALGARLGLSDEQIDDLFRSAMQITA